MTRRPQDSPGYWVVSGAMLLVENGKISLSIKYSPLAVILPEEWILFICCTGPSNTARDDVILNFLTVHILNCF
ncbi:hypothetical protein Lalb_Chr11g0068811 [Lupinus albus]|uniref:Uncharacterized protein n=1 Tax=Lupinus albus TaxID=3870 RepID=A0A6A4PRR8_LUPAL|nr:hypothetical protein Lalb_Chr11g0068811 [Lupinus albus]